MFANVISIAQVMIEAHPGIIYLIYMVITCFEAIRNGAAGIMYLSVIVCNGTLGIVYPSVVIYNCAAWIVYPCYCRD